MKGGRPELSPFSLSLEDVSPGCREVRVEGELDLAVFEEFWSTLSLAAVDHDVRVDLSKCDFVDGSGLAAFVRTRRRLRDRGQHMTLRGARGQVGRLLSRTGMAATATDSSATSTDSSDRHPVVIATNGLRD